MTGRALPDDQGSCLDALSEVLARSAFEVGDVVWPDGETRSITRSARTAILRLADRGLAHAVPLSRPTRWLLTPSGAALLGRRK